MLKHISFWCVLAVALAVAFTAHVAPEVDPVTDDFITQRPVPYSWPDAVNETEEALDLEEVYESDDNLKDDSGPETKEAGDIDTSRGGGHKEADTSRSGGHKIVGGQPTDIRYHSFQVSVHQQNKQGYFTCAGSIISRQLVLTAVHCTLGLPSEFWVRAGSNYLKSGGITYPVTYIYRHPKTQYSAKYDRTDYDVAILRIRGQFNYGPSINPIRLAARTPAHGVAVNVAGWGDIQYRKGVGSPILLTVNLPIISTQVCKRSYGNAVTESMICAGFPWDGQSTCNGDSGGPVVSAGGEQVGIVSWATGCARWDKPSVFANVAVVRPWIQSIMGLNVK